MKLKSILFIVSAAFCGISWFTANSQAVQNDSISIHLSIPGIEVVDQKALPFMVTKIGVVELQKINTRDIGELLRTVPNLSGVRKGGVSSDPVVRGFRASQINTIIDNGVRVEGGCPNRMDPAVSHVEMEDVKEISIVKGPYVLKYGPSMGAFISLNTFMPEPEEKFYLNIKALTAYESNWDGHRQYLNINGGGKKLTFFASGGLKNYGNYSDGEGNTVLSSFNKYNYAAGVGFYPGKNHSIKAVWRESHGSDVKYPALGMDEREDNTRIVSLDYNIRNISKHMTNLGFKLYNSYVYHEMDNHNRSNYPGTDMVAIVDAYNSGFRGEATMLLGKSELTYGVDAEDVRKDGERVMKMVMNMGGTTSTSIKKSNLWYDAITDNAGVFGELHIPSKIFDWTFSARVDYNTATSGDTLKIIKEGIEYFNDPESSYICGSGSAGMTIKTSESTSVKLSIGRGERSPNMTERYIKFLTVGYDNYDYLGNPQLEPEANHQADVTFTWNTKASGKLYMNAFFSYVTNYITGMKLAPSVATPKTSGALGVKQFYNADYAQFRGFEVGYNSPAEYRLNFGLTAAYTYATICEATKYVYGIAGQVTDKTTVDNDALSEIPPVEANMYLNYRLLKNKLSAKVHWRVVGAQNVVSDAMYERETKGFGLLNASITYKPCSSFTLMGGVNNIFDKLYYEHLNRRIVGSMANLYEPGRSFFIQALFDIPVIKKKTK